jgi:hypothetical protein
VAIARQCSGRSGYLRVVARAAEIPDRDAAIPCLVHGPEADTADTAATMTERTESGDPGPRARRSVLARIFGNASLLAFASLLVISIAIGRIGSGLLWAGALLVFFASALERRSVPDPSLPAGRADTMRWCGLALALAGAAIVFL